MMMMMMLAVATDECLYQEIEYSYQYRIIDVWLLLITVYIYYSNIFLLNDE